MLDLSAVNLRKVAITWVGNKNRNEGVGIPKQVDSTLHDMAHEMLLTAMLKPFEKNEEFFYFFHEEDVSNHQIYQSCMNIFNDPETIGEEAVKLTQELYLHSEAPKIQGGEFFMAYFEDLILEGETCNAIGLLKVQTKDSYFKVDRNAEFFSVNVLEGISATGKPEVAALILNLDEADGYRVCAIDTLAKRDDRSYWKDAFLRLKPIEDGFFNTRHYISLSSEFITQRLPHAWGLDRADQMDLLHRSAVYFKENDHFEVDDFASSLFEEPEQQEVFKQFRDDYAQAYATPLEDNFDISPQAVKKEYKVLKSVIKLDKNFHIYVHGRRDLIERGFDDDKGKKYYKVYFDDEE